MGTVLSRALLLETLKTFAAAFVALAVVFIIGALFEMIQKGISGRQIAIVVPYMIVYTLPFLLPVALLVGASLAYGRLAADNEVVALASGGLPTTILARPALLLGLLASFALYGLEGSVIPYGWLKKKDLVKDYIEELSDLGEGENKPIRAGNGFSFFCRRHAGARVEGVEIVLPSAGGDEALRFTGVADSGGPGRPVEIFAERGEVVRDDAQDAIILELWDVSVTQYDAPKEVTAPATPPADGLTPYPPRGAPNHASLSHARVSIAIDRKIKDRTEYRSSAYLGAVVGRFLRYADHAGLASAAPRDATDRALALAGAIAAPGAGPGASGLALAGLAQAVPGSRSTERAREDARWAESYLVTRRARATGPLLFTLLGALLPLRLQHPNRLLPFLAALAVASALFFLPFLAARNAVEHANGASPDVYWIGPALLAAAAALLYLDLRRR